MRWVNALKKAYSAFDRQSPFIKAIITTAALILVPLLLGAAVSVYDSIADAYTNYHSKHLSSAEHLQIAHDLCPASCAESQAQQAIDHLKKIPSNAREYSQAVSLLPSLESLRDKLKATREKKQQEQAALVAKEQAERTRLTTQTEDESRKQMLRNFQGLVHDAFTCSTSTDNTAIISFDHGHYWWPDDGRCAAQEAANEELRQRTRRLLQEQEQRQRAEEQRKRDVDAEGSSYWPTTLRVDTDMDSFWLPNEERTCQTYPDDKGQVAIVACNTSGKHRDHNIPVKFWGGVDRNTVSNWKCRRESEFVCRAID